MSAIDAFANRLAKNERHVSRWAKRSGVSCYRLYDCDVPEVPVIIDRYLTDQGARLHLQEVDTGWQQTDAEHASWIDAVVAAVGAVLQLEAHAIAIKRRVRQRVGKALDQQYQPSGAAAHYLLIEEAGARFAIDLVSYLDCGLFLDHRNTRAMVKAKASNARMLNLFAYTGSFSVHAALGGARSTTTVDLSNTYCQWAERNLGLNGVTGKAHQVVRADVFAWLKEADAKGQVFDLIVLDPPTFSNSKRMEGILDIQRDHADLIDSCMRLLDRNGELFFSNNQRTFSLDEGIGAKYQIEDITRRTIPEDFRDKRIHRAYIVRHRP